MIFVWRGLGFFVPVIVGIFGVTFTGAFNAWFGPGYCDKHHWPFGNSLIVAGVVCWSFGRFLLKRPRQVLITQPTGKQIVVSGRNDHFFFVPIHFWAPILAGIGLIVCAVDLIP